LADLRVVSSELTEKQARDIANAHDREALQLSKEIAAMDEVRAVLENDRNHALSGSLPSGRYMRITTDAIPMGDNRFVDRLVLLVTEASGDVVCDISGPKDADLSIDYFLRWLYEMLTEWRLRLGHRQKSSATVTHEPLRSWGLLDFIYFSAITQTTVGYGDILPNSTGIRLLVTSQVLAGYALLVVFLNVILLTPMK
jgi:hypothetical protein